MGYSRAVLSVQLFVIFVTLSLLLQEDYCGFFLFFLADGETFSMIVPSTFCDSNMGLLVTFFPASPGLIFSFARLIFPSVSEFPFLWLFPFSFVVLLSRRRRVASGNIFFLWLHEPRLSFFCSFVLRGNAFLLGPKDLHRLLVYDLRFSIGSSYLGCFLWLNGIFSLSLSHFFFSPIGGDLIRYGVVAWFSSFLPLHCV